MRKMRKIGSIAGGKPGKLKGWGKELTRFGERKRGRTFKPAASFVFLGWCLHAIDQRRLRP
jgi:hypothetical protein